MPAAAVTAEPAIVCPDCCYDLRGLPPDSDRCPECGLAVETARAREPILPWADRRRIGILIAYAKTVRLVTFRPRQLAADLAVPVDVRAARTFWLVTVLLASLPLCFLTFVEPPFEPRIVNDAAGKIIAGVPAPEGWLVPALFGAKPAPARVAYVLLALAAATRAGRPLFRGNPMTERLARGSVLALYTVAPLVVMPLAVAVGLPIMLLIGGGAGAPPATQFLFGAVALCIPVSWGLAAAAWWRAQVVLVGQATHSPARAVLAALLLPLLWLLCAAAFLFVLPWLLGYAALLAGALG